MGIFKREKKTKLKDIVEFHGQRISYAVEILNGEEKVIGKNGGISVNGDCVTLLLEAKEVFRCEVKNIKMGTLMSGNGADITGFDVNENRQRHIIAYYSNLRQ